MVGKGCRRTTIKDVAARAGVSFKTVSRVVNASPTVNAEIRAAVQRAMAELDYRPHQAARALRSRRTYAIALLAGSRDEPRDGAEAQFPAFLGDIVAGCAQGCRPAGHHLVLELLAYGDEAQATALATRLLDDVAPDGVVLVPPLSDLGWLLDLLDARGVPTVRLLPGTAPDRGTCLALDDFAAAGAIARHLLALGHRHIGFIAGPPDHLAARERQAGFAAAMADVPATTACLGEGDFHMASGEREAERMLRLAPRPTAIFAANDAMAAGALRAAARMGLAVPGDLSVAGFDDSAIARLSSPPLTTMRQPARAMASHAVAMLAGQATAAAQFACELVTRDSTAAPGR